MKIIIAILAGGLTFLAFEFYKIEIRKLNRIIEFHKGEAGFWKFVATNTGALGRMEETGLTPRRSPKIGTNYLMQGHQSPTNNITYFQ